ncbi:MAG: DUF1294 domain-containing protein [Saccharofermentans sp.]|nr:DUF1294 domain-containing protein [Saccharofermentans sp.]
MILVIYLILINTAAFAAYGIDKYKAKNNKWRISEGFLIFLAVLGGSLGALAGMRIWHHKTKKAKFRLIPFLAVLLTVCCIFILYGNYHLVVTEYDVDLGLKEDIKIVQISDLHNQIFGINESVLLDKIREQEPDIIVVTGDVLDSSHTSYTIAESFFKGASEICPVYYITGNHEVRIFGEKFDRFLADIEEMGVILLDDTYTDMGDYILAGVAETSLGDFCAYEPFDDTKPVILLAHDPKYTELFSRLGADLVLTGHVHGGQIILPGKGALLSPEFCFFPPYYQGVYDIDGMQLEVSRGLGNSAFPIRINDYPEIVVINVH